ncbi:MAG: efflux transporter outer membrane subunit [Desulfatitalea sp.]|nr:efflux transporter outer membrane subunit [Desulfatitalea sp.]
MNLSSISSHACLVRRLLPLAVLLIPVCCTSGPDFKKPQVASPQDWTCWRSSDASLHTRITAAQPSLTSDWWTSFNDPVLDKLIDRALAAGPDLKTAVLRFAQARTRRRIVSGQRTPELTASGAVTGVRQSENNASIRLMDSLGVDRDMLAELLSEPYTLYQAGIDFSWELDLWGRVRRSIEAADADVSAQHALLGLTRLGILSDLTANYFRLRSTQEQIRLANEDMLALQERLLLIEAQVKGGIRDHTDLERQRGELASIRANLPVLHARESESMNQLLLLLGEHPGALGDELQARSFTDDMSKLPVLALGMPSEVALRRPDVRAAEARLHRATARIGVARAELYPSITLGARFGLDSYLGSEFLDWGSRTWSVGPSLRMPLFDHGRRKSVVVLRELEQQQAAVDFYQTVLKAWHEIDNALNRYEAQRQRMRELIERERNAAQAYALLKARYDGGTTSFTAVLDGQRGYLQARRDLAITREQVRIAFISINKAVGNAPETSGI